VCIAKFIKRKFVKPPKQSLHNCNRWGSRCSKFNCKRKQWDYWFWKLLGWENTTWTHTCTKFCLPHCGANEWKCSLDTLFFNYRQAARIVKYWFISLIRPVGIHYCNAFRPDCRRAGCPKYKWWYFIPHYLGLEYGRPYHNCITEIWCTTGVCPPSGWRCNWANILEHVLHLLWHKYYKCMYPNTEMLELSGDGVYVGDIFDNISIGDSEISDTESSALASDDEFSDDESVDYEYRHPHLPPLTRFENRADDTDLIMIYNTGRNSEVNFRCKHMSRQGRFTTAWSSAMYFCTCQGLGQGGFEANLNICAHPDNYMIKMQNGNNWKRNFLMFEKDTIPNLLDLAMATLWGHEAHFLMYNRETVPVEIPNKIPPPHRFCLRLNCPAEIEDDCTGICRTKLDCVYAAQRSFR
jgi:hypothetical protein